MATSKTLQAVNSVKEKVPPSINAATRDGVVVIEIGQELEWYHVHKALITYHSEYFRNAFNGSWKESDEKCVTLSDVDPIAFEIFVHWLYTQKLPTSQEFCKMAKDHPSPAADDNEWITALTKSLVFGDRFLAPVFCQAVNNFIVNKILDDYPHEIREPCSFFTAAAYAFENLPEDHILLQFLIEVHCRYWKVQGCKEDYVIAETISRQVPPALLVKIMVRYARKISEGREAWWDEPFNRYPYYT